MATFSFASIAVADAPLRVLTSIRPLQLLAVAVGGDAITASSLLDPQFSPHDYQLRPSDRAKLDNADVIFWIGPHLELFLQPVISALPAHAAIVGLQDAEQDGHMWLDPIAAIQIARRMADIFSELRPAQKALFRANAEQLTAALTRQDENHRAELKRLTAVHGYMVEHDAYSRFEARYGLTHHAALTNVADLPPSATVMLSIKRQLHDGSVTCVWREPQESKLLKSVIADSNPKIVTIDAMAARIPVNKDGALQFYQGLWEAVISCVAM
ncbi:MAG TPA: zinc ABC transporter substrate-binding protein [Spongiibacteraceae bacterium]